MQKEKVISLFINNTFLIVIVASFFRVLGKETYLEQIYTLVSLPIIFKTIKEMDSIAKILSIFLVYSVSITALNVFWGNSSFIVSLTAIRNFIWGALLLFVGKKYRGLSLVCMQKGLYPLIALYCISLYLFFFQPSWYMAWKYESFAAFADASESYVDGILDFHRLTGFWLFPYFISYSCVLLMSYLMYMRYFETKVKRDYIYILLIFITVMLTMQRVAITGCILSCVLFPLLKNIKNGNLTTSTLAIPVLLVIVSVLLIQIDVFSMFDMGDALQEKLFGSNKLVSERTNMFSGALASVSIIGPGLGSMSYNVSNGMTENAVTDQQFIKILIENGIVGAFILFVFFYRSIKYGLKYWKYNIFQLSVVLFFCLTFLGANSLDNVFAYNSFLFWICLGEILSYKQNQSLNYSVEQGLN